MPRDPLEMFISELHSYDQGAWHIFTSYDYGHDGVRTPGWLRSSWIATTNVNVRQKSTRWYYCSSAAGQQPSDQGNHSGCRLQHRKLVPAGAHSGLAPRTVVGSVLKKLTNNIHQKRAKECCYCKALFLGLAHERSCGGRPVLGEGYLDYYSGFYQHWMQRSVTTVESLSQLDSMADAFVGRVRISWGADFEKGRLRKGANEGMFMQESYLWNSCNQLQQTSSENWGCFKFEYMSKIPGQTAASTIHPVSSVKQTLHSCLTPDYESVKLQHVNKLKAYVYHCLSPVWNQLGFTWASLHLEWSGTLIVSPSLAENLT